MSWFRKSRKPELSPEEAWEARKRRIAGEFVGVPGTLLMEGGRVRVVAAGRGWFKVVAQCSVCGAFIATDYIDRHYATLHA